MIAHKLSLLFIIFALCIIQSQSTHPYLPTVDYVDLTKYSGTWNELYRIPVFYEDNPKEGFGACFNTTAGYSINSDGTIKVTNLCYRENIKTGDI